MIAERTNILIREKIHCQLRNKYTYKGKDPLSIKKYIFRKVQLVRDDHRRIIGAMISVSDSTQQNVSSKCNLHAQIEQMQNKCA